MTVLWQAGGLTSHQSPVTTPQQQLLTPARPRLRWLDQLTAINAPPRQGVSADCIVWRVGVRGARVNNVSPVYTTQHAALPSTAQHIYS